MALFDSDGRLVDREGLRSVALKGAGMQIPRARVVDGNKVVSVEHEHGGVAGEETHHPDGRVDANVFARSVKVGG